MADSNFPFSAPTTSTPPLSRLNQANEKKLVVIDCNIPDHSRNDDLRLLTLRFVAIPQLPSYFTLTYTSQVVFRKRWSRIFGFVFL